MGNRKLQTRNINLYKIITMSVDLYKVLYYFRVSYDYCSYDRNHTIILFSIDNLTESSVYVIKDPFRVLVLIGEPTGSSALGTPPILCA